MALKQSDTSIAGASLAPESRSVLSTCKVFAALRYLSTFAIFVFLTVLVDRRIYESGLKSSSNTRVRVKVNVSEGHLVPPDLFGIFFEEVSSIMRTIICSTNDVECCPRGHAGFVQINHAGEGGLYAELINDRSFEGLAYENGFLDSEAELVTLPYPLPAREVGVNPPSWHAAPGTTLRLTKSIPLNAHNPVALNFSSSRGDAEVYNQGFWGISLSKGKGYHLKFYAQGNTLGLHVSLQSQAGDRVYAAASFRNVTDSWQEFTKLLSSNGTDANARLSVRVEGRGPVFLDFVSLFPEENGVAGSVSPFRRDILDLLKALKPAALRVPGGCYVEGQKLASGFYWGPTVGAPEARPGHWNGPWRYWSTDGLGLFEYMQLAEELDAKPVWVVNSGVSHEESVPTARVERLLQNTLASVEFVRGSSETKWGSLRASLGRELPWDLEYITIGNEDCGKPYYASNYLIFYEALHALYPDMRLIANCDMGEVAPTDLWDWHWYTDSVSMFNGRSAFDAVPRNTTKHIYASEYAVFDWGISTAPGGNLHGALGEAGFMTGVERNSDVVEMAAFAPLLVHVNHTVTCPSNLIVFDGFRVVGTPSYHVQRLFREYQGFLYVGTELEGADLQSLAASAVCMEPECTNVALKIVNFQDRERSVDVSLDPTSENEGKLRAETYTLTGASPLDSNSLLRPNQVAPTKSILEFKGRPSLKLPAWSFVVAVFSPEKPAWGESLRLANSLAGSAVPAVPI